MPIKMLNTLFAVITMISGISLAVSFLMSRPKGQGIVNVSNTILFEHKKQRIPTLEKITIISLITFMASAFLGHIL